MALSDLGSLLDGYSQHAITQACSILLQGEDMRKTRSLSEAFIHPQRCIVTAVSGVGYFKELLLGCNCEVMDSTGSKLVGQNRTDTLDSLMDQRQIAILMCQTYTTEKRIATEQATHYSISMP